MQGIAYFRFLNQDTPVFPTKLFGLEIAIALCDYPATSLERGTVRWLRNRAQRLHDPTESSKNSGFTPPGTGRHCEMEKMAQDWGSPNDRRGGTRFAIHAPIIVNAGGREIAAYTRDLSNRGAYFYLSSADSSLIDPEFDFRVELPPEITLSTRCFIQCHGRTVRMEGAPNDLKGVAVEILQYSVQRKP
jgi:hypothetical protein